MTEQSFPLVWALNYHHATGEMAPYFEALEVGRARASKCPTCGDVRMPPRPVCPDDGTQTEAIDLSGAGQVAAVTHGDAVPPFGDHATPQNFVLVAMDGADNFMFGRMIDAHADDAVAVGTRVRLAGAQGASPHPSGAAEFKRDQDQ